MERWLLTHRRSLLFLWAVLALGGMAAAFQLPVALFPNIAFPRIVVTVNAGVRHRGRDPGVEEETTLIIFPSRESATVVPAGDGPFGFTLGIMN